MTNVTLIHRYGEGGRERERERERELKIRLMSNVRYI